MTDAGAPASPGRLRLVVSYDGTELPRLRRATRHPHGRGHARRSPGEGAARSDRGSRPHVCGAHRRRRARVRAGRQRRRAARRRRRWPCDARSTGCSAPRSSPAPIDWMPADFDARRSARWRTYRYTIVNARVPDPFLARVCVVGSRAARPLAAAPRRRPVRRRARLRRVLPQGSARLDDRPARARVALDRDDDRRSNRRARVRGDRRARSAGRWSAPSSARSSRPGAGRRRPGDLLRVLRSAGPRPGRADRAAAGPVPLGRLGD